MSDRQYKRALGIFPSRKDTEFALRELRKSYFPMDNDSCVIEVDEHMNWNCKPDFSCVVHPAASKS